MAAQEAAKTDKESDCTSCGRAAVRALAILVVTLVPILAAYPQAADASMIFRAPQSSGLDARGPFLFQLFVPQAGVRPAACDLNAPPEAVAFQAQGGTPSAKPAAARATHDAGPAPWLVPRSELFALESAPGQTAPGARAHGAADATDPDKLTAAAGLAAMSLIKARLDRVEACRRYLLHLLEMINAIVLRLDKEGPRPRYTIGMDKTSSMSLSMAIAETAPETRDAATTFSGYAPAYVPQKRERAVFNVHRNQVATSNAARAEALAPSRQKKKDVPEEKLTIKMFVMNIVSHPYTYVLLFVVLAMSWLLQRRMG